MSKATAAGLFGLRAINGALEKSVAQVRSIVSNLRSMPTDAPVEPVADDETLGGWLDDATVTMSIGGSPFGAGTSAVKESRKDSHRGLGASDRFVRVAPGDRIATARTPSRPAKPLTEREHVERQTLSPTMQRWIADYTEHGTRDLYLWKWCSLGLELTTLPSVDARLGSHLRDTKLMSIMVNVLLDDIADRRQPGPLLGALLNRVQGATVDVSELSPRERRYVEFTGELWSEYWKRASEYACFSAYERLLAFDLKQLFNSIQYSALLNEQLGLLNVIEHDLYSPHNEMMMCLATQDLMASPSFRTNELGKLREAIWHTQWMGRIGNLLSTWQREVAVGDFTSGVFARAVALGELTIEQLQTADHSLIESSINYEEHHEFYRRRWNYHRKCFHARASEIRSLDLTQLVEGHDRYFRMHMECRGLI